MALDNMLLNEIPILASTRIGGRSSLVVLITSERTLPSQSSHASCSSKRAVPVQEDHRRTCK